MKKDLAAKHAGVGDLTDPWADLGLAKPEGSPAAAADVQAASEEEEVDAFAAFEDLDPFAGFSEFNVQEDERATAGASIRLRQDSAAAPLNDGPLSPHTSHLVLRRRAVFGARCLQSHSRYVSKKSTKVRSAKKGRVDCFSLAGACELVSS